MSYKKVKCIKADDTNILVEDAFYTVLATTPKGNYIFLELDAPEPYNCFDKTRFVDTDMTVGNLFEVEFFSEEEDPYYPEELYTTQEAQLWKIYTLTFCGTIHTTKLGTEFQETDTQNFLQIVKTTKA